MFPGINQKQIEKVMRQMGVKQENINADEVIIKSSDKSIIIKNPHVVKVNMQGNESFQISGDVMEGYSEDDIKIVMEQGKCSREKAVKSLEENNGNLAEAILRLKQ